MSKIDGSEKTPVWTEEQIKAMVRILEVECRIDPDGCGNQWCEARNEIKRAFGIRLAKRS